MPTEFDWMKLINKRAALREQFPPLSKIVSERPGCRVDKERQRRFAEANQMAKAQAELARWRESVAKNAQIQERRENARRAREYRAHQAARKEALGVTE